MIEIVSADPPTEPKVVTSYPLVTLPLASPDPAPLMLQPGVPDVAPPLYRLDEPSHILLEPVIVVGVGVIVAVVVATADCHKL